MAHKDDKALAWENTRDNVRTGTGLALRKLRRAILNDLENEYMLEFERLYAETGVPQELGASQEEIEQRMLLTAQRLTGLLIETDAPDALGA